MKKIVKYSGWLSLLVIGSLFLASFGLAGTAYAQSNCGSNYVVQRGDTINTIATRCGVSVDSLLQANPQITMSSSLYTGQVLTIPTSNIIIIPETGTNAQIQINPSSGAADTVVTVTGSGYPENSTVQLLLGLEGTTPIQVGVAYVNANGNFSGRVIIPPYAQSGETWSITANSKEATGISVTKSFKVTSGLPTNASNGYYIVQRGDTLRSIAQRFGTTTTLILAANPQISNPNVIFPGQALIIPAQIRLAVGTTSQEVADQIPANSNLAYTFYAGANQVLDVFLQGGNKLRYGIYGADGEVLKSATDGQTGFRAVLPTTGYYTILLSSGSQASNFNLYASFPVRISFAAGAISQTVNGRVPANSGMYYVLKAQKGQTFQVDLTPEQGLAVIVYGMDGTVLSNTGNSDTTFSATLPSTQDYIVVIQSGNQAKNYTMRVVIPSVVIPNTGGFFYIVQRGDYLTAIAQRFGVSYRALLKANPQIKNPSLIYPGQEIWIP